VQRRRSCCPLLIGWRHKHENAVVVSQQGEGVRARKMNDAWHQTQEEALLLFLLLLFL